MREGELSRIRANMVNETQLATIARSIEIGTYLHLGKGEIQTGGCEKNSLLSNAFEALMAAIYLDRGYQVAFEIIECLFRELIDAAPEFIGGQDFKSRLQEAVQSIYKEVPRYTVVEETGPDHDKTFRVEAVVGELTAEGSGKSKKTAEQNAARQALKLLGK
jgi:ribonuclease-3